MWRHRVWSRCSARTPRRRRRLAGSRSADCRTRQSPLGQQGGNGVEILRADVDAADEMSSPLSAKRYPGRVRRTSDLRGSADRLSSPSPPSITLLPTPPRIVSFLEPPYSTAVSRRSALTVIVVALVAVDDTDRSSRPTKCGRLATVVRSRRRGSSWPEPRAPR